MGTGHSRRTGDSRFYGDGLTNENETDVYGTDPNDIDTDDDDLTDYEEVMVTNTDPLDSDSDNDTLIDGQEVSLYGTNPLYPMTPMVMV